MARFDVRRCCMVKVARHSGIDRLNVWFSNNPGAYVFNVGAHTGAFTRFVMRNDAAACVAFEPQPDLANGLEALNYPGVTVSRYALMDKPGVGTLHIPLDKKVSGLACLGTPERFRKWTTITVDTTTIDLFFNALGWDRLDFIKIDVEGAELFVLQGGKAVIEKYKPAVFAEYTDMNTAQFGYKRDAIDELLVSYGYETEEVAPWDLWALPISKGGNK